MQWKRPVDQRASPAAGRAWWFWFMAWLYVGCCCGGGAVGGGPLLNLSYASEGVVGYIAWEQGRALFMPVLKPKKGPGSL